MSKIKIISVNGFWHRAFEVAGNLYVVSAPFARVGDCIRP